MAKNHEEHNGFDSELINTLNIVKQRVKRRSIHLAFALFFVLFFIVLLLAFLSTNDILGVHIHVKFMIEGLFLSAIGGLVAGFCYYVASAWMSL